MQSLTPVVLSNCGFLVSIRRSSNFVPVVLAHSRFTMSITLINFILEQSNGVGQENNKINILLKVSRSEICHRENPTIRMRLPFICSVFRWQTNRIQACFRQRRLFGEASSKSARKSRTGLFHKVKTPSEGNGRVKHEAGNTFYNLPTKSKEGLMILR